MKLYQYIVEGGRLAGGALRSNPLRSVLSLLGMTLGIFSIITVFAIVDSLEKSIRDSVEQVGSDIIYVQKWPWGGGGPDYPWWKIFQHPEPRYEEMQKLESRLTTAEAITFMFNMRSNLNYRSNVIENANVGGVSHDYIKIWQVPIERGRYFSANESASGANVALIGADIAEGMFGALDPIGKEVRILGEKVRIIGIFEKEGEKLIGESHDEFFVLPVKFMLRKVNEEQFQNTIMIKAREGVEIDRLIDDVEGAMRSIRRLRPIVENNFAINEISIIQNSLDSLFGVINIGGIIIGGFALLAGGFGIANIMFVSVSERINQIGIQKALGARRQFILLQFLVESIILSLLGGIIGLLLVAVSVFGANQSFEFDFILSGDNIMLGLIISSSIGVIFGIIPAMRASLKDPVEAMRAN